jgi:hypothetical protein
VCSVLVSCEKDEGRSDVDWGFLASDVHVAIAQRPLVLPFFALKDFALGRLSYSLDRKGDRKRDRDAVDKLLRDSADPNHPVAFDSLSIAMNTSRVPLCTLLSREWARFVCANPGASIEEALPSNNFSFVDLSRLQVEDPRSPLQCLDDGKPRQALPQRPGDAVVVCATRVWGGDVDQFHSALVRIDGDLGANWTVWRYGHNGETLEAMTEREGKAIIAFVQYALGPSEDFPALHAALCLLRRPRAPDDLRGTDCGKAALPLPAPGMPILIDTEKFDSLEAKRQRLDGHGSHGKQEGQKESGMLTAM